jgi:putative flippase GtrA
MWNTGILAFNPIVDHRLGTAPAGGAVPAKSHIPETYTVAPLRKKNVTASDLKTAVKFAVVGVWNTALGLAIIYFSKTYSGLGDVAANGVAYIICVPLSFLLNRRWTFQHNGAIQRAFTIFFVIVACSYAANAMILVFGIEVLRIPPYAAHFLGMVAYTLLTYFASKYYAFR